jgi:signal transduction histidine kinase
LDRALGQLFYNLIENSLRYGEKLTKISLHYEEGHDQSRLIYEDDGVGISPDMKVRIFEEGYTRSKGSGMGFV